MKLIFKTIEIEWDHHNSIVFLFYRNGPFTAAFRKFQYTEMVRKLI